MSDTLKRILIALGVFLLWILSLVGFYLYYSHEQAKQEAEYQKLCNANKELNNELIRAESDLQDLQEKQEKALQIAQGSELVIAELKDSAMEGAVTLAAIKNQQQKIRAAVIDLINGYNELLNILDGGSDS